MSERFDKWAEGRSQLEILRTGWPQAGPWELCTWAECPGNDEHPDHCYAALPNTTPHVHIHVYVDVRKHKQEILYIHTADETTPR